MTFVWLILLAVVIYGLVLLLRTVRVRQVVRDYQRGLLYKNGELKKEVGAGAYWLNPLTSDLIIIDTRRMTTVVAGQEVTTQDNIGLKVSATISYEVEDAQRAIRSAQSYADELYFAVQLVLREELSSQPIDALLENRQGLGDLLTERVAPQAQEMGLTRGFLFADLLSQTLTQTLVDFFSTRPCPASCRSDSRRFARRESLWASRAVERRS